MPEIHVHVYFTQSHEMSDWSIQNFQSAIRKYLKWEEQKPDWLNDVCVIEAGQVMIAHYKHAVFQLSITFLNFFMINQLLGHFGKIMVMEKEG